MFLGNLSAAAERKARKSGGSKKTKDEKGKSKNAAESIILGLVEAEIVMRDKDEDGLVLPAPTRMRAGTQPILYDASTGSIPRDIMMGYFETCCKMMLDSSNIEEIIGDSIDKRMALHIAAMEYQRDVLENNFQVERDFGVKYLSSIRMHYPDDEELHEAAHRFTFTCLRSYLMVLNARSKRFGGSKRKDGGMARDNILEFFEGCNALMSMPETKDKLRKIFEDTGTPPNAEIILLQRSILELLGLDADYAVSQLNRIQIDFPQDEEVQRKLQNFALCAQVSCKISMMGEEEKAEFYAQIPSYLHLFPHIWVMAQNQKMMHEMQQNGGRGGHGQMPSAPQGQMQHPVIQHLMSKPESRAKFQELSGRVGRAKKEVEQLDVESWSIEQRQEYFDSFSSSPIIDQVYSSGVEPLDRISSFLEMSDSELTDVIKAQAVLAADMKEGGPLSTRIREAQARMWAAAREAAEGGDSAAMAAAAHREGGATLDGKVGGMLATIGTLGNIVGQVNQASRGHGPGATGFRPSQETPDVSTGMSASMDR